jgi:hypothetical protein
MRSCGTSSWPARCSTPCLRRRCSLSVGKAYNTLRLLSSLGCRPPAPEALLLSAYFGYASASGQGRSLAGLP